MILAVDIPGGEAQRRATTVKTKSFIVDDYV
jgi:hypothetical protein